MANWEFLLQKKGDRQWGTAHKSSLKLKAGSYRIAAQGKPKAEVHIEIIFETKDAEGNPVRRSQNRVKVTNERGLMAIMPFTQLKSGKWEIICRSLDVLNPWESKLQLNILTVTPPPPKLFRPLPLPPNPNLFSFEASLSLPTEEKTEPVETEETVLDRSLAKLMAARTDSESKESLREMVESTFKDLDQPPEEVEDELDDWEVVDETASGLLQGSLLELEELLKEELEPIWQEMEQSAQQVAAPPSNEPIAITPPFIGINLSQPVYIWQNHTPIEIEGHLTELAAIPREHQGSLSQIRLCFTLRNPQTSEKLVFVEQDIAQLNCPHPFRQAFSIDSNWNTLAIVGEISLETKGRPIKILATKSFNLIADYQAIAAQIKLPEIPPAEEALLERNSKRQNLDLPAPAPIHAEAELRTEPRNSAILPPKLGTHPKSHQAPKLPNFRHSAPSTEAAPQTPALDLVGEAILEEFSTPALPGGDAPIKLSGYTATVKPAPDPTDDIPYPFVLEPEEMTPQPEPETPEVPMGLVENPNELNLDLEPDSDLPAEPDMPPADLDWNSRFFTRLNSLAAESEDSSWLTEPEPETTAAESIPEPTVAIFAKDVVVSQPLGADLLPLLDLPTTEVEARPFTMEIVVDDLWAEEEQEVKPEPVQPVYDASGLPYPQSVLSSAESEAEHGLEPLRAVPEPVLHLSKPEYQGEDVAVVRVVLPSYADRLYVKLWMQDRQSRTILVGPYQLTDFTPDRDGNLETLMQMPIPLGTTEVRFEAIAINPRLQQESRKVGVDRRVVPQNVSEINWDDLGI